MSSCLHFKDTRKDRHLSVAGFEYEISEISVIKRCVCDLSIYLHTIIVKVENVLIACRIPVK